MIEGTSNPFGSVWCANLVRRVGESEGWVSRVRDWRSRDWRLEALVFSTNFRTGFDINDFQAVLPKNLIHHVVPGEPVYDFFEAWKQSAAEASAMKAYGLRQWFMHSAEALVQKGYKVNLQKKFLARGYLIWER